MRTTLLAIALSCASVLPAVAQPPSPQDRVVREILKELIEINTTDSVGSTTTAADAMAARLKAAGFPEADVRVLGPNGRKGNLVARLRGRGTSRPILLLAHLDVVEANKADWSPDIDPFTLLERDGYFYGRGTSDDKGHAALWVANLIRLKQEGYIPDRDIIVALTADEEGGTANGVDWLLEHHRDLIDAEYALNEGGGGEIKDGKRVANVVEAAQKVYHSVALEVRNPGGHSSLPRTDNAIYRLAAALSRLAAFEFPVQLNDVTRGYFATLAASQTGQTAADMKAVSGKTPDAAAARRLSATSALFNSMMRTTCVATQLQAGHAENALPQLARAVINCRILPGVDPHEVEVTLRTVIADDGVVMSTVWNGVASPPSPLRADLMSAIDRHTQELWPGVPVLPTMSTGATDALYLRKAGIATYGVDGIFADVDDDRSHGKDERIGVQSLYDAREFLYRLIKSITSRN